MVVRTALTYRVVVMITLFLCLPIFRVADEKSDFSLDSLSELTFFPSVWNFESFKRVFPGIEEFCQANPA